jgi:chaperonin GroEL
MEEIYFKNDAKEKLLAGINKLHDAVSSTLGPKGRTVIIANEYGQPYVTKDGVSVARAINFKDPVENIGATLVKEVAELTLDKAGDGTTTSIVLATAFINNLKDFDSNDVSKAFEEIIPKVLEQLKLNSRELKHEDIKYVASISANNDLQIGDIIQQAYTYASIIKVEEGTGTTDTIEFVKGMTLQVSYMSKNFINTPTKAECNFTEPLVLLLGGKLETLVPFEAIINEVASSNKELLVVTEHVSEKVLRILETNVLSHGLKLCVIKSPGFSTHRADLLNDLSDFTGATVIKDFTKTYTLHHLGKLESVKVSKSSTLLVKHSAIDVTTALSTLTALSTSDGLTSYEQDLVKQRVENLTGAVSIIKVGASSEVEMKERFDRYDDAVKAVDCALEEGIVEGGGESLKIIGWSLRSDLIKSKTLTDIFENILDSLYAPQAKIIDNGGGLKQWTHMVAERKSMFDLNIIDPLKVTRYALLNAVSVAKTILTTNTVILNERQWT